MKPPSAGVSPRRVVFYITAGGNLVFRVNGQYPQQDDAIRQAWQRHYDADDENAPRMQCLVTGQTSEIALTHPMIKGVRDAQSSGAALVSFNASAFCSYGQEQSCNAPVGKQAAFAYTTALNTLLAQRNHVQQLGDATVVCWAEGAFDLGYYHQKQARYTKKEETENA